MAFSKNQATFLDIGSPKVVNLFKIDVAITAYLGSSPFLVGIEIRNKDGYSKIR